MKRGGVRHSNIASAVSAAEITGCSLKNIRKLPPALFKKLDYQYNSMPSMIVELEDTFYNQEALKCRACLFKVSRRMCEITSQQPTQNREWFIMFHGPEVLVNILKNPPPVKQLPQVKQITRNFFSSSSPLQAASDHLHETSRMRIQCMTILRELCFSNSHIAQWLAIDNSFLVFLFSLLSDKRTFDSAIGLIEEILAARTETFNLASVNGFGTLVRGLSKGQLGIFCRILSMVIFEPDDKNGDEVVSSLELLNVRKNDPSRQSVRNIDRNHAVIIGVPDLLNRLVKLLRVTSTPDCRLTDHIIAHFPTPSDLIALRRQIDQDDNNWDDDDVSTTTASSSSSSSSSSNSSSGNNNNTNNNGNNNSNNVAFNGRVEFGSEHIEFDDPAHFKMLALSTYQVELLFVIYALLAGKRRADLQDQLAKIGLISTLSTLFDTIDWLKPPPHIPPDERMHGPNCECNPESTLKIQFLRLVLNFCDGDFENRSNKKLLLSSDELASLHDNSPMLKSTNPPGLLVKLIQVFSVLPADQPYRFWMSSCIEAFLRGSEPVYQIFVGKKCGMLRHLVDDILAGSKSAGAGGLQTAFDLLGELMKFNREIFEEFNKLIPSDEDFTKFINNVTVNLVDSNVFLRAMILSMERFRDDDIKNKNSTPYPFSQCKIARFLEEQHLQLIVDLMTVISVEDINQENICCVNTALVLLIFAQRHNKLSNYLQRVREQELHKGGPQTITTNFRKLLWFWNEYYAQRGRDCLSLEFSSQIRFTEWISTYNLLVQELGDIVTPIMPTRPKKK